MQHSEAVKTPANLEWVDGTRSIAAMAVVLLHVAANVVLDRSLLGTGSWWLANVLDAATRWCVPVFVLLSGALLLNPDKAGEPWRDFYRKRFSRVLIPLLFWSLFYVIYQRYPPYAEIEPLPWLQIWQQTRIGMPYFHLWFMFMLLGLYAITPWLRQVLQRTTRRQQLGGCALLLVLAMLNDLHTFWMHRHPPLAVLIFLPYIAYFIAGYLLRFYSVPLKAAWLVWGLSVLATAGGLAAFVQPDSLYIASYFYDYFSISTVPAGLAAFVLCMQLSRRKIWSQLAPLSMGIYLIHPLLLDVLWQNGLRPNSIHPVLAIALIFALAMLGSAALTALFLRIPLLRRVV